MFPRVLFPNEGPGRDQIFHNNKVLALMALLYQYSVLVGVALEGKRWDLWVEPRELLMECLACWFFPR